MERGRIIVNNTDYTGSFVTPNPSEPPTKDLNTLEIEGEVFNIAGSGGGSDVEANPSGTATENLYKVDIDGTIYDIKSGNGNFKTKVLLNQSATSGTYSLADDYTNYDLLAFWTTGQGYESGEAAFYVMTVDDIKKAQSENRVLCMTGINRWFNFYITTSQFIVDSCSGMTVVKIVGYKIYADCYNPIIYSTEEREIGVWIDNKPLYQKTVPFGSLPNYSLKTLAHNIANIDKIISYEGIAPSGTIMPYVAFSEWDIGLYIDNVNINVQTRQDWSSITESYVTIQYTKTTDVAGSGSYTTLGVPAHHYDGNERVIGTWFGETLYEKTLVIHNESTVSSNTTITTIDSTFRVKNWKAFAIEYGVNYQIPYVAGNGNASFYFRENGNVEFTIKDTSFAAGSDFYITIEYTKTTD